MSTYMVVGTLFLGYSVSHMWYITTFPEDPPWLKFFWMNCFISAMCYGFLAPWITSDHLGLSWGCWQF
jgi:creatinine amidohydrolase/Fe(II)-dependent formamide hydrolase-like protein